MSTDGGQQAYNIFLLGGVYSAIYMCECSAVEVPHGTSRTSRIRTEIVRKNWFRPTRSSTRSLIKFFLFNTINFRVGTVFINRTYRGAHQIRADVIYQFILLLLLHETIYHILWSIKMLCVCMYGFLVIAYYILSYTYEQSCRSTECTYNIISRRQLPIARVVFLAWNTSWSIIDYTSRLSYIHTRGMVLTKTVIVLNDRRGRGVSRL